MSFRGVAALFDRLRYTQSIVDLCLDSNEGPYKNIVGSKGAEAIKNYLEFMKQHSTLTHLSLKCCNLGNEGLAMLTAGLKANSSLIYLNLRGN